MSETRDDDALESIAETDNEELGEDPDEISEGVTCPITDDTATEDETVDNTQGSDDEGCLICLIILFN